MSNLVDQTKLDAAVKEFGEAASAKDDLGLKRSELVAAQDAVNAASGAFNSEATEAEDAIDSLIADLQAKKAGLRSPLPEA